MVKIESTKRKKWDMKAFAPQGVMAWINVGAWLLSMFLWWTTLSSPQVIIHSSSMMTDSSSSSTTITKTTPATSRITIMTPDTITSDNTLTDSPPTTTKTTKTPPVFLVQSFTKGQHDRHAQRNVLSFTTVPSELKSMDFMIQRIVSDTNYNIFDAIHINIPWTSIRFSEETFASSTELVELFPNDPRIIVNRLMDYGPMTRYYGAIGFEQHPDTRIIVYDIDSDHVNIGKLSLLLRGSKELDPNAIWCNFGEDFIVEKGQIKPYWGTYPSYLAQEHNLAWNLVYFCRGARGILVKPKHFEHFVLNATDYHHSCFWDDDRFVSFQMGVLGFERKNIHPADWYTNEYVPVREQKRKACQEAAAAAAAVSAALKAATALQQQQKSTRRRLGTLSAINNHNKPDVHCTAAFVKRHPNLFPLANNATAHCPA